LLVGNQRLVTYEEVPNVPDPTPPSAGQIVGVAVGIRAATPAGAQRAPELLALDGAPRAMVLLRFTLPAAATQINSAVVAIPVAIGGAATPHAQLVDAFDAATVTWATAPAPRSQSYPTGVTQLTASTTAQLDVTQVVRQGAGQATLCMALILDADTDVVLHPAATLVIS
jgi:hypothetical protein